MAKTAHATADSRHTAANIMESAERLCGERGLEAVSIRDIAADANISISVIYHHFGSKSNLLRTICQTRAAEVLEIRAAMLEDIDKAAKPDLRQILYAIVAPLAQWRQRDDRKASLQFFALALVSRLPEVQEVLNSGLREAKQLVDLLQKALPHLSREEVCWRLHFTKGIEHQNQWDMARVALLSDGLCKEEEAVDRAVEFLAAAFEAPSRKKRASSSSGSRKKR